MSDELEECYVVIEEQRAKLFELMDKKCLTRKDLILILNAIKPKEETLDGKHHPIIQIGTVHTLNLK